MLQRKAEDLRQWPKSQLPGRREATVREVYSVCREVVIRGARSPIGVERFTGEESKGADYACTQTPEERGGGERIRINAGVDGGRGMMEMVLEPGWMGHKVTADRPMLPVVK